VNTTTCDDSANYVYLSYTTGECITLNSTHFVADCSTGRARLGLLIKFAYCCY
jgi:hypothetical protein